MTKSLAEILYYPCIADASGKIRRQVSKQPMTKGKAEDYLKTHFRAKWLNLEAIPQPVSHPYFKGAQK